MNLADIFLLALALAVDAFVVSFSYGLIIRQKRRTAALKVAGATAFGQFVMPILGWYGARGVYRLIEQVDHWIAFFVFLTLGLKVIVDSLRGCDYKEKLSKNLSFRVLLVVGLATSIDASVSGSMLYFVKAPVFSSALIIGATTFVCSLAGFNLCRFFKKLKTCYLEQAAGVILILLGCKVLYEHLS
ncbi:MAG: manganese efflux pump [Alphaproteobacteria bacterium]|nr:manganese efflux pump [Alphaproteobacteria bacterium]